MKYFLGIDSGTQSTKALLIDDECGRILARAAVSYTLLEGLPPGHKEQDPAVWISAVTATIDRVLRASGVDTRLIAGIGVSGQQHGFVPLDEAGQVICPAKLWCDTSTAGQCERLMTALGGFHRTIELLGNRLAPGFTASKILWLKEQEPRFFARLRTVLLPHDYINYWLTGVKAMEYGDASGTGLLDVRTRSWCRRVIDAIDPSVWECLPPLIDSGHVLGTLRPELAAMWGVTPEVIVSAGGGDNMMGAIGTGNIREGIVTASLGTSGTLYACSSRPVIDLLGEVEGFCDSAGQWLPLVCTMNVTVATEMVRESFGLDHAALSSAVAAAPPGADGLLLIPFFEGERTPNCPYGTGVFFGLRPTTYDVPHMARAAMEGATLGMNYGLQQLRRLGVRSNEIRVTGGGAKSAAWRQIMADVFNAEIVGLHNEEGAAYGAALQALWAYSNRCGHATPLGEITDRFVTRDEETRQRPYEPRTRMYEELQALYNDVAHSLRDNFRAHRRWLESWPRPTE
ncbi:MAG: xylulokinase [Acidobacteria bacterium]|nr:xylulokinase [Acidobacteriota bacterium]MBI3657319.1 xylulokinase [Acidobacteriota bacterium]